ncbi:MAG: hypothetical protein FWD84_03970 [Oscillospiraceae bacterium]|nr:hypothetical protein [Oscillospiraceae bacterium]
MRKITATIALLALGLIACLVGCSGNAGQAAETILDSELLAYHGIEIGIPENPHYRFFDSDDLAVEVALRVPGDYGTYYFTPGDWSDELIAELVLVSEDGLRFAKDFLGMEVSRPLSFVFNITEPDEDHPFPIWGGAFVLDTSMFFSMEASLFPSLIVHETVHAILAYADRQSNFPQPPETSSWAWAMFLEEGLCDLIDFLFAQETAHNYPTNYGDEHLHTVALRTLNQNDHFSDELEFGTRYPQLMSYETAASFIYFLLEHHGTIDDFMRVFDDIYLMEDVFGQTMEGMIAEWIAYLNEHW